MDDKEYINEEAEINSETSEKFEKTFEENLRKQYPEYESDAERAEKGWWTNGRPGSIFGIIRGFVYQIMSVITTPIKVIAEIAMSFRRGYSNETRKLDAQKAKESDKKTEKEAGKKSEKEEPEKKNEKINSKERDSEAELILNDKEVEKAFSELGLTAFPLENSDLIYLCKQNDPKWIERVTSMSKEDLISGDAETLAAALLSANLNKEKDYDMQKVEAAANALICQTVISNRAYGDMFKQKQIEGEKSVISQIQLGTSIGKMNMEIVTNPTVLNKVDLLINGERVVQPFDISDLQNNKSLQCAVKDVIVDAYKEELMSPLVIKGRVEGDDRLHDLSFTKREDGRVEFTHGITDNGVREEKIIGVYSMNETKDLGSLSARINRELSIARDTSGAPKYRDLHASINDIDTPISAKSIAYAVGIAMNPYIKESEKDGKYYDLFSRKYVEPGAPHMGARLDKEGVVIGEFIPQKQEDGSLKMVSKFVGEYETTSLLRKMDGKHFTELVSGIENARKEFKEYKDGAIENYMRPVRVNESAFISPESAKNLIEERTKNLDEKAFAFDLSDYLKENERTEEYEINGESVSKEEYDKYMDALQESAELYTESMNENIAAENTYNRDQDTVCVEVNLEDIER